MKPIVGRGEDGEIVIIHGRWAASFERGQWFPGIRFDEIDVFRQVRDPSEVKALICEARRALVGVPEPVGLPADNRVTSYAVFVDDNFHYMDVSKRYGAGEFADYESAVARCKGIVYAFLVGQYKPGMKRDDLWARYRSFGEDPFIRPNPPAPAESFSAWTYGRECCETLCRARRRRWLHIGRHASQAPDRPSGVRGSSS